MTRDIDTALLRTVGAASPPAYPYPPPPAYPVAGPPFDVAAAPAPAGIEAALEQARQGFARQQQLRELQELQEQMREDQETSRSERELKRLRVQAELDALRARLTPTAPGPDPTLAAMHTELAALRQQNETYLRNQLAQLDQRIAEMQRRPEQTPVDRIQETIQLASAIRGILPPEPSGPPPGVATFEDLMRWSEHQESVQERRDRLALERRRLTAEEERLDRELQLTERRTEGLTNALNSVVSMGGGMLADRLTGAEETGGAGAGGAGAAPPQQQPAGGLPGRIQVPCQLCNATIEMPMPTPGTASIIDCPVCGERFTLRTQISVDYVEPPRPPATPPSAAEPGPATPEADAEDSDARSEEQQLLHMPASSVA